MSRIRFSFKEAAPMPCNRHHSEVSELLLDSPKKDNGLVSGQHCLGPTHSLFNDPP